MNAYELAYEYVQHTNCCIFLTGKAGTGKTTFLRRLKQECLKQLMVVAPTGVAAINAEGVTIHSLFQLPPQLFLPTDESRRQLFAEMQMRAAKQRVLRNLELLVIDEISMVRADLLDAIDAILRHFKHRPHIPFGGVQLLFIGDLFQLSPVARESEWRILQSFYDGPYFFQARVFREIRPKYIELDHVFRQTNIDFVQILNQVRSNTLTSESLQMLNTRYIADFDLSHTNDHIVLSTHNNKVDAINQREIKLLKEREFTYFAQIKDTFPESIYPMDKVLTLKVGARVMFVKNDSSQEKLYYNGKLGVVTSLSKDAINVTCEDGMVVNVHKETWENIRYTAGTGSDSITSEVIGSFTHFPLRLAWAITIHKAQGLTFDRVVIDAADAFAAGQVYVALSRCRSLEGVVLLTPIQNRTLTNAKDVICFTANQSDIQTTKKSLESAQTEYLVALLCASYDFQTLIDRFFALSRAVRSMNSVQGDKSSFFAKTIGGLEGLQVIAERFQQQLRQIVYSTSANKQQRLIDRLRAAADYFAPKLKDTISCVASCPLRTNDRTNAAYLKQHLMDIHADLLRCVHIHHALISNPTIDGYFNARKTFRWVEPDMAFHTAKKKVRSDASAFRSLTLFYRGMTIPQIAKQRKITIRTVVRHLQIFIELEIIHISNFTSSDQLLIKQVN